MSYDAGVHRVGLTRCDLRECFHHSKEQDVLKKLLILFSCIWLETTEFSIANSKTSGNLQSAQLSRSPDP